MLEQIQNISTWRHDTYTLKPGLNEIYFNDTRPNAFYVVNNNNTYLYVGLKNIPTNTRYERKIRPNECDCFGRPLPVDRIYIINPKDIKLYIEISSIHENFTLELLKSINASMDDEQINRIRFDGVINGWNTDDTVMTNIVNLQELKDPVIDKLQGLSELQAICNQKNEISNIKLTEIISDITDIKTKIDSILSKYDQSFDIINNILKSNNKDTEFKTIDLSLGSTTIYLSDLILISNDTDTDILINDFMLKPGESMSDIYNLNTNINIRVTEGYTPTDNILLPVRLIYTYVKEDA